MPNFQDLTGQKFNRLTVIEVFVRGYRIKWKCACECGSFINVRPYDLKTGKTKSCGCYYRETRSLGYGEATFNQLYTDYKMGAVYRNLDFQLSKDQFRKITQRDCFYCGVTPGAFVRSKHNKGDYQYNGIDRINSLKGYSASNCVPCCKICNRMKSNLSMKDFVSYVGRLVGFQNKINEGFQK